MLVPSPQSLISCRAGQPTIVSRPSPVPHTAPSDTSPIRDPPLLELAVFSPPHDDAEQLVLCL